MRSNARLYASLLGVGLALSFAPARSRADQVMTGICDAVSQGIPILIFPPTYTEGDYRYSATNGMAAIVEFNNTAYAGALTITNTLGGYPVVEIGQNAFAQCQNLTDVTVPDGVTNIWVFAFSMCYGLRSVHLPATLRDFMGGAPFFQCNKLASISVDPANPTYWSDSYGVLYCRASSTLVCHPPAVTNEFCIIPDCITNIEAYAFLGSRYLSGVSIPAGVLGIGKKAFFSCVALKDVTLPVGVTRIEDSTFNYCTALTNIVLSPRTEYIGTAAFEYCTSLASITIPSSVTNINGFAFAYSGGLSSVFFEGKAPALVDDHVFSSAPATVYYLPGAAGWGDTFGGCPTLCWNPTILHDADFGFTSERFGFTIASTSNIPIVVQATTNLSSGVWTSLTNATLDASEALYFSDEASSGYPSRFYRIVWP